MIRLAHRSNPARSQLVFFSPVQSIPFLTGFVVYVLYFLKKGWGLPSKGKDIMRKQCFVPLLGIAAVVYTVLVPSWPWTTEAGAFEFPDIPGWKRSEEVQTFDPKTLYEYINGASDAYLSCDFEELKVAEYADAGKGAMTADVYRHRTPAHAFGIYSAERLQSAEFLDIGVEGWIDKDALNFLTGSYYVKLSTFNTAPNERQALLAFARSLSGVLGGKGDYPPLLAAFPSEGKKVRSERFIAGKFLGYPFLRSAFTADYDVSGKTFQLFVIDGQDPALCRTMMEEYLRQTGRLRKGGQRRAICLERFPPRGDRSSVERESHLGCAQSGGCRTSFQVPRSR